MYDECDYPYKINLFLPCHPYFILQYCFYIINSIDTTCVGLASAHPNNDQLMINYTVMSYQNLQIALLNFVLVSSY